MIGRTFMSRCFNWSIVVVRVGCTVDWSSSSSGGERSGSESGTIKLYGVGMFILLV